MENNDKNYELTTDEVETIRNTIIDNIDILEILDRIHPKLRIGFEERYKLYNETLLINVEKRNLLSKLK
jgi:hypothetical protein